MKKETLLIIFVQNSVPGKVKPRLVKTMGEEKAQEIYNKLTQHTHRITKNLDADKAVYYSEEIVAGDIWDNGDFQKFVQSGGDPGKRMLNAFKNSFSRMYRKVVMIECDCFELTGKIISEAFESLPQNNFVVGPTHDGAYYLLGMTQLYAPIFKNKKWNSENVLHETLVDIRHINGSYKLMKELTYIDTEADLLSIKSYAAE